MNADLDVTTLDQVLESAISPLDSLAEMLRCGGWHDIAHVGEALLSESRARLRDAAQCVEASCGRPVRLRRAGSILLPVRCEGCPLACCASKQGRLL